MVLDFIPCDVCSFSDLFNDYNKILNIPELNQEEMLFNLLDNRFCKYINKKGKYKGKLCMRKFSKHCNNNEKYCYEHRYQEKKCKYIRCNSKCKKTYDLCNKHFKLKNKYKTSIEELNEKHIINNGYGIDTYIYYYPIINIYDLIIKEKTISHVYPSEKNKNDIKLIKYHENKRIHKDISNDIIKKQNSSKTENKLIDKNILESYLNSVYYILNNEINANIIKSFLLKITYILSNNFNIKLKKTPIYGKYKTIIEDYVVNNINIENNDNLNYYVTYKLNNFKVIDKYDKHGVVYKTDINKQLIIYSIHGIDVTYKYYILRIKKYTKNKKKNDKKKLKNLYKDQIKDESLNIIEEYFYKINGNENECYECNKKNNRKKNIGVYYLHYNIIYELYNCNSCSLSNEFIEVFGIKIINNIEDFVKDKKINYT